MSVLTRETEEFAELLSLAGDDVNLAQSVRDFLDSGLEPIVLKINGLATDSAGDTVHTYQLAERLQILLLTARAKNRDSVNEPVR